MNVPLVTPDVESGELLALESDGDGPVERLSSAATVPKFVEPNVGAALNNVPEPSALMDEPMPGEPVALPIPGDDNGDKPVDIGVGENDDDDDSGENDDGRVRVELVVPNVGELKVVIGVDTGVEPAGAHGRCGVDDDGEPVGLVGVVGLV